LDRPARVQEEPMSVTEVQQADAARPIPFAMRDSLHVPRERYYDRGFYELEKEYLWSRVWQMACRLEEIPRTGDWVEYEICDQSILVVRQADASVKAFYNTCPHRATQLLKGVGRAGRGQIVCPFHGWRWNIDGTSSFVYGAKGFAPECVRSDEIRLQECRVETWGGSVWINMDPDARPLQEALSPAASHLDAVGVENMRVWWWKEVVLNANWKIAQEAFFEGWHVMQTHPQLTMGAGTEFPPDVAESLTFENGHSLFRQSADSDYGVNDDADEFIARARVLWEGQDAMTLERDLHVFNSVRSRVAPGDAFAPAAIMALYEYAKGARIPMPPLGEGVRLWGGDVFLFPNYLMLPMYGNSLAYRSRPYNDDPEWCRFEIWSLTTYPEGQEPERALLEGRFASDDAENWGLIPRQDMSNIERQQRGLHARSYRESRLSTDWEQGISNMHQELDRYLGGQP
jgi:phenylpropionate dioxygenase-like ring-hydroxylating dioxygenase large terminal subunit